MATDSINDRLQAFREKETRFLQNLQGVIHQAKQELNNDLTRLAIKNMPMIMMSSDEQNQQVAEEVIIDDEPGPSEKKIQELEPLDLDV